jgi:hypothetical protein
VDGHGVAWDVVDHVTTHCKARITVEPVEHTIIWDTVTAARQPVVNIQFTSPYHGVCQYTEVFVQPRVQKDRPIATDCKLYLMLVATDLKLNSLSTGR